MNGISEFALPSDFVWKSEHDEILEKAATSDYADTINWETLRNAIKFKLDKNISEFFKNPPVPLPPPPPVSADPLFTSSPSSSLNVNLSPSRTFIPQGLRLPPFLRRKESQFVRNEFNSYSRPKAMLTEQEAYEQRDAIFALLHDFDKQPPFSIQRLCELVVRPRGHYQSLGKYLRAAEKSLLVTSTVDAFPPIPIENQVGPSFSPLRLSSSLSDASFSPVEALREATTPLFSPIPFLHEDARRSKSRSPPVSPLVLAAKSTGIVEPLTADLDVVAVPSDAVPEGLIGGPVIGMVDELDDPSPGHMSEHPTALTATTSATPLAEPKPLYGSLQERFSSGGTQEAEENAMLVDDQEADKENKQ